MRKHHADGLGRPARGLTLVEVLAVITIIALLIVRRMLSFVSP